ncbi:hypothetical protein pgond44_09681 [Psychroflexus gondwanensis ACAM 44]|uniref:Sulfotransferase family protein n=1 Tax=Psychroflexus gondwanensis ACAM 44 TaxID=1189619 RepID=N1WY63_9FLAO|nr:sulfotransferase family 2 domain-containing protein [Psychroflexus gondwanensis]EMY80823.1 hypothetical protein pgond44_09681 [Psychroflexus gondwanensis ACAM 44]
MKNSIINKVKSSSKFKKFNRSFKVFYANNFINNSKWLPEKYDRIYHLHIRKSGGTSINSAFWNLSDLHLDMFGREPIINKKGKTFVRMSKELIEHSNYFYASSHFPLWQITLRPNTYSFTVLRDPYKRLVSLYKYYNWVSQVDPEVGPKLDPTYPILYNQKSLLNKSFKEFMLNLSDKYLFGQLYFYSKNKDVKEAIQSLTEINKVFFLSDYETVLPALNKDLNLSLREPGRKRDFGDVNFNIDDEEKEYAIHILRDEIKFYNKAKQIYS